MSTTTNLTNLEINVLTEAQYNNADKNNDSLYLITDDILEIEHGGTGATTAEDIVANIEDALKNFMLNTGYRVGTLYFSKENVSPASFLGGTWERIKDKFILAAGDTYAIGATGGSATVTLQTTQIPSHTHTFTGTAESHYHSSRAWINSSASSNGSSSGFEGWSKMSVEQWITTDSKTLTPKGTNSNTGGGGSHENMPPYEAYYVWRRAA